ncbi:MAG: SDR family oxidoreductase [Eudoraea sp.]|nr:SDR family oxidoreductase [Eudoraea sp.]MBT8394706.1 SDR family oxidoreductase [Bacteroidia bacterium]NNL01672.1 SDR family oxidoreductase [Eudoraea sp.]
MTTLVVGATGATGKHLVDQLLNTGQKVKIIVRSPEKLPESWKTNDQLSIIQANISDITEDEMAEYIQGCNAIASCLGHNMNWKGLYGKPRKLVTDAVRLLCNAIKKNAPDKPVKIVLMNTSGNRNRDLNEPISIGQRFVIALLRLLLPPHVDNEKAADYLRTKVGQNHNLIEWVAVRPDGLVNEDKVTAYEVYPSPIRSAIFNAGTVSRINVGHFMAELITEYDLWNKWKGQMPVIYKTAQKNS